MNLLEELTTISESERKNFLSLGIRTSYPTNCWLPGLADGFFGIRLIERGEVEVCAVHDWKRTPVLRYGPGQSLGIRGIILPDSHPKLAWKSLSNLRCTEFDGVAVRNIIRQKGSKLRTLFSHAAHLRDIDIRMAIDPLFSVLPMDGRSELFDHSIPLALAPSEALPTSSVKALYFVTKGSLHAKENPKTMKIDGDSLYIDHHETWIADSWCELLTFDPKHLNSAINLYPIFGGRLKAEG